MHHPDLPAPRSPQHEEASPVPNRGIQRRTVLIGGALLSAGAAACGSDSPNPDTTPAPGPTPTATSAAAPTTATSVASSTATSEETTSSSPPAEPTPQTTTAETTKAPATTAESTSAEPTSAEPTTAAPTTSAQPAPTGERLAALTDIPDGGSLVVGGGSAALLLARSGSTVSAHSAICTHQGCTVGAAGAEAHCPCHGSRYVAATGAVLQGPAPHSLPERAVTVFDGAVYAS